MGYAFTTLIKSGGDITDTVDILLLRGFLSPAGHMAWTGIAAAALYAAAATRRPPADPAVRRRVRRRRGPAHPVGQPDSLIGTAVVAVASLGLLALTAHRAAARATVQADPERMTGARVSGPSSGR